MSKSQQKLGAKNIRWTSRSGKFTPSRIEPEIRADGKLLRAETQYAKLQFGNQYYEVTEKVGNYMIQTYQQAIREVKTKSEMEKVNTFFKQMMSKEYGTTGVLFENIIKAGGMEEMFRARLKGTLSPELSHSFDNLVDVLSEINKDRIKAQNFYDEVSKQFNVIGNKYEKMQAQGGTLDATDLAELESAINQILEIALDYVDSY